MTIRQLELNDLAVVNIKTDKIVFERYRDCKPLGSFILIDRMTHQTVAAGMIKFSLRRATNISTKTKYCENRRN